jgi:hypothetical protein
MGSYSNQKMPSANLPSLADNLAYNSAHKAFNRLFSDPTGLLTSTKRTSSGGTHWGLLVDWISKYNTGVANTATASQIDGLAGLNSTGFDRWRTGGEFFIPYIGTLGYYITDVAGRPVFAGGSPLQGIKTIVDGPADVGVNMQSEIQHTYTEKFKEKNSQDNQQRDGMPIEMLSGDWVQITPEGNFIGCYRGGMNLIGSSQWAEILTSRIDHLVRIRSRTFEHFDALGERRSYNDEGELTYEVLLTDDQAESYGSSRDTYENAVETDSEAKDGKSYKKLKEPGSTGEWRLRMHVGYLGDMLHLVFTQPDTSQKTLAVIPRPDDPGVNASKPGEEPKLPAIGVAELFIGSDGSIVSRSTKDLMSEKVGHIRVPMKKREAYDPKGDTRKAGYEPAKRKAFEWDASNLGGRHLQENEFREWEVDHTEMYRIRGHQKDWSVNKRKDAKCPSAEAGVEKYQPGISIIHQRNDGSVYIQDHWASTIQMVDGDIILAPSRDLMLQPGRDIALISPRDTVIRAKKFVDITSSEKDVRIKAQLALYMYSKYSGILLETSSSRVKGPEKEDSDPTYTSPVKGVELGPEGCSYTYSSSGGSSGAGADTTRVAGIRLHLREAESAIEIHTDKTKCPVLIQTDETESPIRIQTAKSGSDIQVTVLDDSTAVSLEAKKQIQLIAKNDMLLRAGRHILSKAAQAFAVSAGKVELMGTVAHIYGTNKTNIINHLHEPNSTSPGSKTTGSAAGPKDHQHSVDIRHQHYMRSNPNIPNVNLKTFDIHTTLHEFKFEYRKSYDLGKKIYYTYWQFMKNSGKVWKQKTGSEVEENVYPGKDFKFTEYTPGILKIADKPDGDTYSKGSFSDKGPEYPMVDLGLAYSEDNKGS